MNLIEAYNLCEAGEMVGHPPLVLGGSEILFQKSIASTIRSFLSDVSKMTQITDIEIQSMNWYAKRSYQLTEANIVGGQYLITSALDNGITATFNMAINVTMPSADYQKFLTETSDPIKAPLVQLDLVTKAS